MDNSLLDLIVVLSICLAPVVLYHLVLWFFGIEVKRKGEVDDDEGTDDERSRYE